MIPTSSVPSARSVPVNGNGAGIAPGAPLAQWNEVIVADKVAPMVVAVPCAERLDPLPVPLVSQNVA
jgi:hypothetical protein